MKRIGITAPRVGLTPLQDDVLAILLGALNAGGADEFHHGDCARGAEIARWFDLRVVDHPPVDHQEPDRLLVTGVDLVLGFPGVSSGYTINYAHYLSQIGKPRIVVGPTGTLIDLHGVPDVLERIVKATLAVVIRARASHEPRITTHTA